MSFPVRSAVASSSDAPTSATVLDFICLFTHDLRRKQKRWQDGKVKFHTFNKRYMVYDDRGNFIGDGHWPGAAEEFEEGVELQLDRGSAIVQVSECVASREQDLTELLDKRAREVEKRRAIAAAKTPAPSAGSIRMSDDGGARAPNSAHRSLSGIVPSAGPIGRAVIPDNSPFEMRRINLILTDQSGDRQSVVKAPPAKKRRVEASPPSKSGHAQNLFGTRLTLTAGSVSYSSLRAKAYRDRLHYKSGPSAPVHSQEEQDDAAEDGVEVEAERRRKSMMVDVPSSPILEHVRPIKQPSKEAKARAELSEKSKAARKDFTTATRLAEAVDDGNNDGDENDIVEETILDTRKSARGKAATTEPTNKPVSKPKKSTTSILDVISEPNSKPLEKPSKSRKIKETPKMKEHKSAHIVIDSDDEGRGREEIETAGTKNTNKKMPANESKPVAKSKKEESKRKKPDSDEEQAIRQDRKRKEKAQALVEKDRNRELPSEPTEQRTALRIKPRKKRGLLMLSEKANEVPKTDSVSRESAESSPPQKKRKEKKRFEKKPDPHMELEAREPTPELPKEPSPALPPEKPKTFQKESAQADSIPQIVESGDQDDVLGQSRKRPKQDILMSKAATGAPAVEPRTLALTQEDSTYPFNLSSQEDLYASTPKRNPPKRPCRRSPDKDEAPVVPEEAKHSGGEPSAREDEPDKSPQRARPTRSRKRVTMPIFEDESSSSEDMPLPQPQPAAKRTKATDDGSSGPRIGRMARKSVKSKEIFGFVVPKSDLIPAGLAAATTRLGFGASMASLNTVCKPPKWVDNLKRPEHPAVPAHDAVSTVTVRENEADLRPVGLPAPQQNDDAPCNSRPSKQGELQADLMANCEQPPYKDLEENATPQSAKMVVSGATVDTESDANKLSYESNATAKGQQAFATLQSLDGGDDEGASTSKTKQKKRKAPKKPSFKPPLKPVATPEGVAESKDPANQPVEPQHTDHSGGEKAMGPEPPRLNILEDEVQSMGGADPKVNHEVNTSGTLVLKGGRESSNQAVEKRMNDGSTLISPITRSAVDAGSAPAVNPAKLQQPAVPPVPSVRPGNLEEGNDKAVGEVEAGDGVILKQAPKDCPIDSVSGSKNPALVAKKIAIEAEICESSRRRRREGSANGSLPQTNASNKNGSKLGSSSTGASGMKAFVKPSFQRAGSSGSSGIIPPSEPAIGEAVNQRMATPDLVAPYEAGVLRPRIANPATRGKKAARKEDAAGQVPQCIVPFEPAMPRINAISVTVESKLKELPKADKGTNSLSVSASKPGISPGFTSASGGAWSVHAGDLLGITRPQGKPSSR